MLKLDEQLKFDKELRGWVYLTAIIALIFPVELSPYFFGDLPDLGWKQYISAPANIH